MLNVKPQEEMNGIASYRDDFPALSQTVQGHALAYLDSASSAQKPQRVIDAMNAVMTDHYANIHRGLYEFSQTTTSKFEAVRGKVARFINAESENEIVFTRNSTSAINLVAASWGGTFLSEGDEVILTEMEHHANIVPWQLLRDKIGIVIKTVKLNEDGSLDMDDFERLLSLNTKLISVVHISNALGVINDVKKITAIAKDFYPEMKVVVDGSQAVVHQPVDVQDIGCDFYVFTGHKLYGPNGVGVLWGRSEILNEMPPYEGGGDMIEEVVFEQSTFKAAPARFEAGTPAIVEVIGLGEAIDYLSEIGMQNISDHEAEMLSYAAERFKDVEGLTHYGTAADKVGILSFTAEWGHPSDIGMILDQCGVAIRTGHHCCQPLMQYLDIQATARASFGLYTNTADIDQFIDGLLKARKMLA